MKKKQSTSKTAPVQPERKADGSWGSFPLCGEEAARLTREFMGYVSQDEDELFAFLILIKSLTYQPDQEREEILYAVERELMPYTLAQTALDDEAARRYRRFVEKGGER